jgi:hypothetical protein
MSDFDSEHPGTEKDDPDALKAWATKLVEKKQWVLHVPTLTVGPVKAFFDGTESRWKSTIDGGEVPAPVLELETGHGFVARESAFHVLDAAQLRFYIAIQQGLAQLVGVAARGAAGEGVDPRAGFALVISALRAQLIALEGPTKQDEVLG